MTEIRPLIYIEVDSVNLDTVTELLRNKNYILYKLTRINSLCSLQEIEKCVENTIAIPTEKKNLILGLDKI